MPQHLPVSRSFCHNSAGTVWSPASAETTEICSSQSSPSAGSLASLLVSSRLNAFAGVEFDLAAFSGATLGLASSSTNTVWLDVDGAGLGWSLDATSGGYDLLSAVSHEIGHKLGYDHDVMEETLAPGERHLASEHVGGLLQKLQFARTAARRDAVFASLNGNERESVRHNHLHANTASPADTLAAVRAQARSRAVSGEQLATIEDVRAKRPSGDETAHDDFFSSLGEELAGAMDLRI